MRIRSHLPEILFLTIAAAVIVYVLFVPPMVGLADSGDFSRLTNWFGLSPAVGDPHDALYLFVIPHWEWHRQLEIHYPSSEVLLVGASLLPMLVMPRDHLYDIRLLGAVHAICFLLVLLLLTRYARSLPLVRRLLLYGLVVFMFADVGYLAYFRSFFSEPAGFLFTGAVVAFALALVADREPGRRRTVLTVGYFASCVLLITAKLQYFPFAFPLAVLGYRLAAPTDAKSRAKTPKHLVIGLTAALPLIGLGYYVAYSRLSDTVSTRNVYNAIFSELLANSPTPEADAAELGLDTQYLRLIGTSAMSPGVPYDARVAAGEVGTAGVAKFYARHPDRFLSLLRRVSCGVFWQRPLYLGNYERSYVLRDGSEPIAPRGLLPDNYFSRKFAFWSLLRERTIPRKLWFLTGFLALNGLVFLMIWIRSARSSACRMTAEIHGALLCMAVLQFLTIIVGEGNIDLVKHLFLFNFLCEISFVFLLMYGVAAIASLCQKRRSHSSASVAGL